ncbi:MAG: HAD family hydrolase [Pseudomonadota bacterium]
MTPQIRAVLFDKDGTLFDFQATWADVAVAVISTLSEDPGQRAELARVAGFDMGSRRFQPGAPLVAASTEEIAELWAACLPNWTARQITDLADRTAIEAAGMGALRPAARDLPGLLDRLRAYGLKLGVATHDTEASARHQLEVVGVLEAFDFLAGYDTGFGLKPSPGMLHGFAESLAILPEEVAMVGDSVGDLAMVPNGGGGMAIGVLTGPAERVDLEPHADAVLDSIEDLERFLLVRGVIQPLNGSTGV